MNEFKNPEGVIDSSPGSASASFRASVTLGKIIENSAADYEVAQSANLISGKFGIPPGPLKEDFARVRAAVMTV